MPSNQSIDSIFISAISKNAGKQRDEFLAEACGVGSEIRKIVDRLLEAHFGAATSFLERPADGLEPGKVKSYSFSKHALDAGMSATFGTESVAVVGSQGHSVLKSLGTSSSIALPGEDVDSSLVENPRSGEIPRQDSDSRYQLHGEIARGGMGAIIKGRDTDLGRDLAIKVLLDSHKAKPEYIQRFVEEAQIGGQLQHPGIVPVYELGQFEDERPFFTMKLIKGKTLASILAARKSPCDEIPKLLGIFEQICQTMAYAHSKGVIHRDLKPANVMVGAFGEVQVMDWGLSKVLQVGGTADEKRSHMKHRDATVIRTRRSEGSNDSSGEVGSDTRHGSVMGTPAYMPPEQALGEVDLLGTQADVFGLGAILAEILTGKPPYVAEDSSQVFRMATRGKLEDCFERLDQCAADEELVTIAKQSLAAEVDDRFVDAGALARGIESYQHGVQEQLRKTEIEKVEALAREDDQRRRKKLYVAIAGLLVFATAGGLVGALLFAGQQTELAREQKAVAKAEGEKKEQALAAAVREQELSQAAITASIRVNARRLVAESAKVRNKYPVLSGILALEAAETTLRADGTLLPSAFEALLNSTINLSATRYDVGEKLRSCSILPGGRWLVTGWTTLKVWDLSDAIVRNRSDTH